MQFKQSQHECNQIQIQHHVNSFQQGKHKYECLQKPVCKQKFFFNKVGGNSGEQQKLRIRKGWFFENKRDIFQKQFGIRTFSFRKKMKDD